MVINFVLVYIILNDWIGQSKFNIQVYINVSLSLRLSPFSGLEFQIIILFFLLAPLIGGCNLEFPLENDANLLVSYTTTKNIVEFQWANTPLGPRSIPRQIIPTCEDQVYQDLLEYSIHVRYLPGNNLSPERYFEALKKMLTPEDIIQNGVKVKIFV